MFIKNKCVQFVCIIELWFELCPAQHGNYNSKSVSYIKVLVNKTKYCGMFKKLLNVTYSTDTTRRLLFVYMFTVC